MSDFLAKKMPSDHPLADHQFETDGIDLFVQQYGKLISLSESGQLSMRQLLSQYLQRIERDTKGIAIRLYLFTRVETAPEVKAIVIDPAIQFGRPVIAGTGIPTSIVAERYKAGESFADLARDYDRTIVEIEEAIRCELPLQAA